MYTKVVKHQKLHKYLYITYIIYSKCIYVNIYILYIKNERLKHLYIHIYSKYIHIYIYGPFQVTFLQKVSKHIKHITLIKTF